MAADEVVGELGDELRHEGFEGWRIFSVGEAVAFEGAGDEGFIYFVLVVRECLPGARTVGAIEVNKKCIWRFFEMVEFVCGFFGFVRGDKMAGGIADFVKRRQGEAVYEILAEPAARGECGEAV